jgi:hypothetical protein
MRSRSPARDNPVSTRIRERFDPIAVTHPNSMLFAGQTLEQRVGLVDCQGRRTVLAHPRADAPCPKVLRDDVKAIADAEHRAPQVQHLIGNVRRVVVVGAGRTSGEDDAARLERADLLDCEIERVNFAIHVGLPHTPRDELRVLAAEIKNQDHFPCGFNIAEGFARTKSGPPRVSTIIGAARALAACG